VWRRRPIHLWLAGLIGTAYLPPQKSRLFVLPLFFRIILMAGVVHQYHHHLINLTLTAIYILSSSFFFFFQKPPPFFEKNTRPPLAGAIISFVSNAFSRAPAYRTRPDVPFNPTHRPRSTLSLLVSVIYVFLEEENQFLFLIKKIFPFRPLESLISCYAISAHPKLIVFRNLDFFLLFFAQVRALISCNTERTPKSLWTDNEEGTPIRLLVSTDGASEADQVHPPPSDMWKFRALNKT
jgi:hypothetical protein